MTYVSCYYHAFQGAQQVQKTKWPPCAALSPIIVFDIRAPNTRPLCVHLKLHDLSAFFAEAESSGFPKLFFMDHLNFMYPIIVFQIQYK